MPGLWFALAAISTALVVGLSPHCGTPDQVSGSVLACCAAFVPYALLCVLSPPSSRLSTGLSFALALLAAGALCRAPSTWSDDVYRHVWDGKLVAHGVDPYGFAPEALQLQDLRDANFERINHRAVPTIYPPLTQLLFGLGYLIHPSPLGQKLVGLGLHLLSVCVLWLWLRCTRPDAVTQRSRAVALLALNPLALVESALSGHLDVAAGALVIGFVWGLPRLWPALCALAALCAIKLVGVVLAPLLWPRSRFFVLLALGLGLLAAVPLAGAGARGGAEASGLRHYATRWRGNAAAFGALEAGAGFIVDRVAGDADDPELGPDEVRMPAFTRALGVFAGTPLDLRPVALVPRKQPRPAGVLARSHVVGVLARLLALALVVGLVVLLVRKRTPVAHAARLVLFAVLLLSPQVHPWYLLWLLPLEIGLGGRAGVLWSALLLSAYAPTDLWRASRHWIEPSHAAVLQSVVVLAALGWQIASQRAEESVDPRRPAV